MLEGVAMGPDGEILEINWQGKDLKGTFSGAPHMPSLRKLDLTDNPDLQCKSGKEFYGIMLFMLEV